MMDVRGYEGMFIIVNDFSARGEEWTGTK